MVRTVVWLMQRSSACREKIDQNSGSSILIHSTLFTCHFASLLNYEGKCKKIKNKNNLYRKIICRMFMNICSSLHFDERVGIAVGVHGCQVSTANDPHQQAALLCVVTQ